MLHILFLLFACFSLNSMEPDDAYPGLPAWPYEAQDRQAMPGEEEPLLDGTDAIELNQQLEQIIDQEELPSPLYDGSRRFYDEESPTKLEKKPAENAANLLLCMASLGQQLWEDLHAR